MVFYFFFGYSGFAQKAIKEARIIRHKNSILKSPGAVVVLKRLDYLMDKEKILIKVIFSLDDYSLIK